MPRTDNVTHRYLSSDYLQQNPTWDSGENCPWKARLVLGLLESHSIRLRSIVDVGCSAGGVLVELRRSLPSTR